METAADGDLTELQYQFIASEDWHELLDIQPDPHGSGTVRLFWSDGESFLLLPNAETDGYQYENEGGQAIKNRCPLCGKSIGRNALGCADHWKMVRDARERSAGTVKRPCSV